MAAPKHVQLGNMMNREFSQSQHHSTVTMENIATLSIGSVNYQIGLSAREGEVVW